MEAPLGMSDRVPTAGLRTAGRAARRFACTTARRFGTELDVIRSREGRADFALFHEFAPSPSGGGHQFLRALTRELATRGVTVELNRVSAGTPACLFNSFNFDFRRLRRFAGRGARWCTASTAPSASTAASTTARTT